MSKYLRKSARIAILSAVLALSTPAWSMVTLSDSNEAASSGKVTISGTTDLQKVTVRVKRSNGTIIFLDVVKAEGGVFETSFTMPEGESDGAYQVEAGEETDYTSATFMYNTGNQAGTEEDKKEEVDKEEGSNKEEDLDKKDPDKEETMTTDKSQLLVWIGKAAGYKEKDYTKASWEALQTALAQGRMIYSNNKSSQAQIDEAAAKLQQSMSGLVKKQQSSSSPEMSHTSSSQSSTSPVAAKQDAKGVVVQDNRKEQTAKVEVTLPDKAEEELKKLYNNGEIKSAQVLIENTEKKNVIKLGLKINGQTLPAKSSMPSMNVSAAYDLEEGKLPEYLAVRYISEGESAFIYKPQYNKATGKISFSADQAGEYEIIYNEKHFSDLDNVKWAQKAINVLSAQGIINGKTTDSFVPKESITRADYIVLLMKTLNLSAPIEEKFSDVAKESYYYEKVNQAKKLGIVSGKDNNQFAPLQTITREEMMVMTEKALRLTGGLKKGQESTQVTFEDSGEIAPYAKESIDQMVSSGLISGADHKINPKGKTTRAEAAVLLYRIYNMN